MEVSGLLHVPAALSPKNGSLPRTHLLKSAVGPRSVCTFRRGEEYLVHSGILTPDRQTCSLAITPITQY